MIEAEFKPVKLSGGCLCGGVRYAIEAEAREVVNCFCEQCRKTSGHYVAATRVDKQNLRLESDQTLSWYESSPDVKRGFCKRCGGNLFWDNQQNNQISVMAGTLDAPTGMRTTQNIFEQDASDYFELPDIGAV